MRSFRGLGVVVAMSVLCLSAGAGARVPAAADSGSLQAKLDETLDSAYTKTGDKVVAVLQEEAAVGAAKLPKGTKLMGTVVRAVKQDKQHPNSGFVLRFDSAVPKGGAAVPVHVSIVSLAPSRSDEVEQVSVGSGDVTDASLAADVAAGVLDDANESHTAVSTTAVNGVKVTSSIKGVVLFASPNGKTSGVVVARVGPLLLDKYTRLGVVVTAP